jgi:hypothetical protein
MRSNQNPLGDAVSTEIEEVRQALMRIVAPGGAHVFVDFEPSGGVYGIEKK